MNVKVGDIIAAVVSGLATAGVSYWTTRSTRRDVQTLYEQEKKIRDEVIIEEESEESEEA